MTSPPSTPRAPARSAAVPERGTVTKLSRLRRLIGGRMRDSLAVSAQLTAVQEADLTRIAEVRVAAKDRFRAVEGIGVTFLPFVARAAVAALERFPQLNATIDESGTEVSYHPAVHLGVAVDTPRGLVVPVVRDADGLSVVELARRIADLAERTRANRIGPDELTGSTFTITNIGSAGSLLDTPIINQPEVAILATGAVRRLPRVVQGPDGAEEVVVRSVCYLPLTYDHRLVDGADAGRFLAAVRTGLEDGDPAADLGEPPVMGL